MKKLITVTDVDSYVERRFPSWIAMASYVIARSTEHRDYTRFLPACNNWNLDYPKEGETVDEYRARMIAMAIELHLIG